MQDSQVSSKTPDQTVPQYPTIERANFYIASQQREKIFCAPPFATGRAYRSVRLYAIAHHHDLQGNLLNQQIAAVDLLNVIRPTVAVARYVAFSALALQEHPDCQQKLKTGEDNDIKLFVQEEPKPFQLYSTRGRRLHYQPPLCRRMDYLQRAATEP